MDKYVKEIENAIAWADARLESTQYRLRCLAFVDGLSLGNGDAVHAWNKVRMDHYLAVEHLEPAPSWEKPKFIGWAPVETILSGKRSKCWE